MSDLQKLQQRVVEFRNARDWEQFHNPKDLAVSLLLEAAEFLEHFQWKSSDEIKDHLKKKGDDVSDELADVLYWVLLIANDRRWAPPCRPRWQKLFIRKKRLNLADLF